MFGKTSINNKYIYKNVRKYHIDQTLCIILGSWTTQQKANILFLSD
jgi:hypothetical protein